MTDPKPLRVVHYPGEPEDLGVVVREDGGFVVHWQTGECDDVTRCGRLESDYQWARRHYQPAPPRLPTVTRRRAEILRAWLLYQASSQQE
jgi:hypothetical protein